MHIAAILCGALALSGCATVTRGTTNDVTFNSAPSGATVTTSIGQTCVTPCMMEVPRNQAFTAIFNLEGFEQQFVQVNTRVATAGAVGMAGNVVLGGIVGAAVDASTGAMNEHYPNPVFVNFTGEPIPGVPSATPVPAPVPNPSSSGVPVS